MIASNLDMAQTQTLFNINEYDLRLESEIVNADILTMTPEDFKHAPFRVCVVDCPWSYDNGQSGRIDRGGFDYGTFGLDELQTTFRLIDSITDDSGSLMYVWGTWPKFDQFARVTVFLIDELGWQPVSGMPWIKVTKDLQPRFGIGYWWGSCSEYFVMFRKGKVSPPDDDKPIGLLAERVFENSKKPKHIYELAQRTPGPYVNVFAREPLPKAPVPLGYHPETGIWTCVGNELGEYINMQNSLDDR